MSKRREILVSMRKKNRWLQKDVIKLLKDHYGIEITESYYGMIEQGVRTPKLNIALAISELFKVKPNEIFFNTEPNKNLGGKSA